MASNKPIFKVGEEIGWRKHPKLNPFKSLPGPFIVVTIQNFDQLHEKADLYAHTLCDPDVEENLDESTISQWITIQYKDGKVLCDDDGAPLVFDSGWFLRIN